MEAKWQKGNQTMPSLIEQSSDQINYYLHVGNVQPKDAGTYVCDVRNSAGKTELSINVDVLGELNLCVYF
jgi:hypothetical protein